MVAGVVKNQQVIVRNLTVSSDCGGLISHFYVFGKVRFILFRLRCGSTSKYFGSGEDVVVFISRFPFEVAALIYILVWI